jgi:predicted DNA-binding helix-hairpin-helix protein
MDQGALLSMPIARLGLERAGAQAIRRLTAAAIVQARRSERLRSLQDLQRLGVRSQQAAPFILFDGRAPSHQLRLFPT